MLIADEAVSALDVSVQAQVLKLLTDLREQLGLSIIFITHKLREVLEVADRIMVLRSVKVVGETTPTEATEDTLDKAVRRVTNVQGTGLLDENKAFHRDLVSNISIAPIPYQRPGTSFTRTAEKGRSPSGVTFAS